MERAPREQKGQRVKTKTPTMLMILDGFGVAPAGPGNAISLANTPHLDHLFATYPHTTIRCCGEDVGLPAGQMGNSEVGHLNIGGGRIIYQDLLLISNAIRDGSFFANEALEQAMDHARENGRALHLFGLVSDGGVHSHVDHLIALLDMAKQKGVSEVAVHAFLDGRDVPPKCAKDYLAQVEEHMSRIGLGRIATVAGRYYAMDRDKRWERIEKAYDAITRGEGEHAANAAAAVDAAYARGESDEFVLPTVLDPAACVEDGDAVIMFNFRPDRAREITRTFVDASFDGFARKKEVHDLCYITMTEYDATLLHVRIAYPPGTYKNTLGEYVSSLGLTQLRIAETEKYAHVTFFFNGGVEPPNPGEDRILIPSPKVATYDLQPEMSAYEVTDTLLAKLDEDRYDLIILNFANCDMVGHTGVLAAAVKAVEAVDECVGRITEKMLAKGGRFLLTADHGNADVMIDEQGGPMTAHSLNVVPLIHVAKDPAPLREGGRLSDLAPTLLDMMDIPQPAEMTGQSLLVKET